MNGGEESDWGVLPMKWSNNGRKACGDRWREGPSQGECGEVTIDPDSERDVFVSTGLDRVRWKELSNAFRR